MIFFPTSDEDLQYFRGQGYTGSLDDMHYKAFGDLGYTGSLQDRAKAYLIATFGSYHEALRGLQDGSLTFSLSPVAPAGAIQQRDGGYILDRADNYIEVRT